MTNDEKLSNDDIILSMSPVIFIMSVFIIVVSNTMVPADFSEMESIAQRLLGAEWIAWIALGVSSVLMGVMGIPSLRSQIMALVISTVGAAAVITLMSSGVNLFVCLAIQLFALVPVFTVLFNRLTSQQT